MQKLRYLLFFMLLAVSAKAQFKILFVDDSGDGFGNAEYLASTLDSLGYESVYYDAIGQGISPTAAEMSDFDLVIWYTSTWGIGLELWNGSDTTNTELAQYLSQPNANLWLIGLDYFYDRYGAAPVTFQQGDFPYDHLGISKYAVQSYADDGGLGVPLVTPSAGQPITGLGDISWQFSTLWYADGFELRPEATPVYQFGGNGYVFNGKTTGVWYHPAGGARVLTYGFDLALAANFDLMRTHVSTVLNWWQNGLSAEHSPASAFATVSVSPNTFSDHLEIRLKTLQTTEVRVGFYNASGQLVGAIADHDILQANSEKVLHWEAPAGLADGIYYCTVQAGQEIHTTKMIKQGP